MPFSISVYKLLDSVEPSIRRVLLAILEEIERQREESVTKKEFNELKEIVRDLAEAQRQTEQRLNTLAVRVDELAEAQRQTEQRLNTLAVRVDELAEAQRQTEQRLNELGERVNELAEAQKRTEEEVKKLVMEHRKTRENLGGLQHSFGYLLEDRAYKGLPSLLARDFNIDVTEPIRRDFVEISSGEYVEINIIGKGKRNGNYIWIVGECKTQLKKRDVDKFLKELKKLEKVFKGEKLILFVTYQTSLKVKEYINQVGGKLYFSYELPL